MISVEAALAKILALAAPPDGETLPLDQVAGRVLLEATTSRMTQPPFDAAAMDGYALRHADLPQRLQVIGESAAGRPWKGRPAPGSAIRIFTGASVPEGYDRVEMQENTQRDGDYVTIVTGSDGTHIRKRGSDFAVGDRVEPGRIISPADIGLLAAMNVPQVTVARRPKVVILAGGNELVRPGETPAEGQIISSNDLTVAAIARLAGAQTEILPIARDTTQSLRDSFAKAAGADLIVTIGGVSVGDHDLVAGVAESLGIERAFYKVAMRPGKPLMAGKLAGGIMLGLPGNPVSAMVCALIFMQPLIWKMQGADKANPLIRARLTEGIGPEGPRQHYLRARLSEGKDLPCIRPFGNQDSSLLSVLTQANALLIRPPNDPARKAEDIVEALPLFH